MSTKRRPIAPLTKPRVTRRMVQLWGQLTRSSRLIGNRRIDAELELDQLCKRKPWQEALTDIDPDADAPSATDLLYARGIDGWYEGQAIVRALEAAVDEEERD